LPPRRFPVGPSFLPAALRYSSRVKRIPLAALIVFGALSFVRADDGAFKNLVGMAKAAETDRGPDAEDAPDRAPAASIAPDALRDAVADVPVPRAALAPQSDGAPMPAAAASPVQSGAGAAPKARLWTRLYSTLLPSWRRPPSLRGEFDPAVSTAAVRATVSPARVAPPSPDSEAVAAGERRGLSELMSVPAAARAQ
jgi:hypothetical protein